ncbi:peptidoglycan editing factor PgeF [Erythrobacter sp. SCSIO 43205]|uniref:peptidoglycan editing factor PgeF n=1 Tax=Erythrobacter sp. SCSIO 43205 TaxID=2779361 RepID=UPI001CA8E7B2|nr:peptidoglycan editing factor PgeF [Erythrobacter sp. SCSIO 43205]UAB78364.1 peptidoglycan editing factor PgeF [Erythrobacter sp. SCSIO 43205]
MAETPFHIERSPELASLPHAFFGSAEGLHQFGFGGPGDSDAIQAVRAGAASALVKGAPLVAPHQVHSCDVITVDEPWSDEPEGRPVADALVTNRPGIVLGIVTADCGPVLFADEKAGVVGAAHAGWRGAHGGILENTLAAMEALGAQTPDIAAVLGPTIAQESYEVDAAFRENFMVSDDVHFAPAGVRDGRERWHFDLPGYIAARLNAAGVGTVSIIGQDTYAGRRAYYSYRRATQEGAPDYGRQLSAIAVR